MTTDEQVAYVTRFYIIQAAEGLESAIYFSWLNPGKAGNFTGFGTTAAESVINQAYQQIYTWLVGSTITAPCSLTNSMWICPLTLNTGQSCQIVWSDSLTSYNPGSSFTSYQCVNGTTYTITPGNAMPITFVPVLLKPSTTPITTATPTTAGTSAQTSSHPTTAPGTSAQTSSHPTTAAASATSSHATTQAQQTSAHPTTSPRTSTASAPTTSSSSSSAQQTTSPSSSSSPGTSASSTNGASGSTTAQTPTTGSVTQQTSGQQSTTTVAMSSASSASSTVQMSSASQSSSSSSASGSTGASTTMTLATAGTTGGTATATTTDRTNESPSGFKRNSIVIPLGCSFAVLVFLCVLMWGTTLSCDKDDSQWLMVFSTIPDP